MNLRGPQVWRQARHVQAGRRSPQAALPRSAMAWIRSGSSSTRSTVARGLKAASGSWNTICSASPHRAQARAAQRQQVVAAELDACRRRARQGAAPRARASTCRCPTGRPAPVSRLAPARRSTPSSAANRRAAAREGLPQCRSPTSRASLIARRLRVRKRRRRASRQASEQGSRVGVPRRADDLAASRRSRPCRRSSNTAMRSAKLGGQRDVVADEQQRHAVLAHQRVDQRDDLGLDDGVERAGRLVGDQQLRPAAIAAAMPTRCRWPPESWCG